MANRGVPQDEVFAAADAVFAGGERPTTDKVRAALGRGSPNAIGPVLDRWWAQLAQRHARQLSIPGLPDAAAAAFAQAWELAVAAGTDLAEAAIAPERAALAEALAAIETRVAAEREAANAAEAQRLEAVNALHGTQAALAISEQRAGDLQREVAALTASVQALSGQREAAEARLLTALGKGEAERTAAAAEREALQAHLRHVEDRAYTEVDRARQELKSLKSQLTTQAREHAAALRSTEQARRTAEAALGKAARENATLQTKLAKAQATRPPGAAPPRKSAVGRAKSS
jgi:hypothetical protein